MLLALVGAAMPLQKPPFFSWVVLKQLCIDTASFLHVATLSLMPFNLGFAVFCTAVQTCCRDYSINFLVYLFIYKLYQEAWITHRATSTTSSRGKKKKKISNTTNKNDNTKKRQREECQCKNRIWEDIDWKINNTYNRASCSMAD